MKGAMQSRRFMALCAAILLSAAHVWAADALYAVKKIYNGSSIKVQGLMPKDKEIKVRYIGVDAPDKGKPFYEMCRNANKALVENRQVALQPDTVATDTDGKLLAYVTAEGILVNAELIKNGNALAAAPDGNMKHRDLFLSLQQEARKNRRGFWAFEDQSDEPYYVGSKTKKIFHRPSCFHVKGLAFDDRLIFRTKSEALAASYSQDWRCCPLFLKPEQTSPSADDEEQAPSAPLKR